MKNWILFIAILFSFSAYAQVDVTLPDNYDRIIKKGERKLKKNLRKGDVSLYPGELQPIPVEYSAAPRNWGLDYMEVDVNRHLFTDSNVDQLLIIMDTGGEYDHPLLKDVSLKGYDTTNEGLQDDNGHSTHCGGIVAAQAANIGVAKELGHYGNLKIVGVKILHGQGYGIYPEIREGAKIMFELVKEQIDGGGQAFVSNSWGGSQGDDVVTEYFQKAYDYGAIITASSGNEYAARLGYPASLDFVWSVGSLDQNGKRSNFSNYSDDLFGTAPGGLIYSTYTNSGYATLSGTSMSNPAFMAAIIMLRALYPEATRAQIYAHLQKYLYDVDPNGKDKYNGYGAPKLTQLLSNDPTEMPEDDPEEDDPEEDDPEEGTRELRTITNEYNDLTIVWGIGSMKDQRLLDLEMLVDADTKYKADYTYDEALEFTQQFFTNRGLMFTNPQADAYDALKYTIIFYEMFAKPKMNAADVLNIMNVPVSLLNLKRIEDFTVDINRIIGIDEEGRVLHLDGAGISPRTKVSLTDIPIIYDTNEH